jgi:sarcosine oxidase, subunit beta
VIPDSAEVVIIGGGIVGCAAAYYLAQQGADVLLLERRGIGSGASGRSGGGVRQSARATEELPLALESVTLFPTLADELGVDLEYAQAGNLRLVEIPDHIRPMQLDIARQQELGLDLRWLTAEEVRELVPALAPGSVFGASYCPTDGHTNPFHLVTAYYQAACRAGARVVTGRQVLSLQQSDAGHALVETADRVVRAGTVVIAAGPGSLALCLPLGFDLPLATMCYESMITEALPPAFSQMFGVGNGDLFFRQTRHGGIHFGGGTIETGEVEKTSHKNLKLAVAHISQLLPMLRQVSLLRTWGGLDPSTPDGIPIIDRLNENVLLATGFCGHGLAIGPVVGRHLAQWIARQEKPAALAPFRHDRFQRWLRTRWTPSGTFEAALATDAPQPRQSSDGSGPTLQVVSGGSRSAAAEAGGQPLLWINPSLCTGCRMCEMACSIHHEQMALPVDRLRIRVAYPSDEFYLPLTCIHCVEAYCMASCPVDALARAEDGGLIHVIDENCTGCMLCVKACPYGGIHYIEEKKTVVKCDLCGGSPACAVYCPTQAITFAPLADEIWAQMKETAVDNVWALVEKEQLITKRTKRRNKPPLRRSKN